MAPVEPYWQRLPRLRDERGLKQDDLFRRAKDVSLETIAALERDPAKPTKAKRPKSRYPSAAMLVRICDALDVPPEEFPEYRLALARDRLDDRIVGLDRAVAALGRVEQLLK